MSTHIAWPVPGRAATGHRAPIQMSANPHHSLLKTSVAEISWPAITDPEQSQILALLYQLEQSQWWAPERLLAHQRRQAAILLRHAQRTVPLYREALAGFDFAEEDWTTEQAWRDLPRVTRHTLQSAGQNALCEDLPSSHGQPVVKKTSGSTGEPALFTSTGVTELFWNALTLRDHLWHRRDFGGRLLAIRSGRYAKEPLAVIDQPTWGAPAQWLFDTGASTLMYHVMPVEQQAEVIRSRAPHNILTHPSNAVELAEHFRGNSEVPDDISEIRTYGEVIPEGFRTLCAGTFGAQVTDLYSTVELGYIALQCPEHDHYHVQCESVLVEVLNDDGLDCRPGDIGRVVVTSLHNFAMPLIRYETGDYAKVGPPCPCGRGLPVLERVLGRRRNQILLPDGRTVWPLLPLLTEMPHGPVQKIQLVQRGADDVEVRVISKAPLDAQSEKRLKSTLRDAMGPDMRFDIQRHDRLERQPTGKFEWVLSEPLDDMS